MLAGQREKNLILELYMHAYTCVHVFLNSNLMRVRATFFLCILVTLCSNDNQMLAFPFPPLPSLTRRPATTHNGTVSDTRTDKT